jgi:nucleotide-binding universal stress UspA family protein
MAEHAGDLQSEALLLTNGGMDALASESHDLDLLVRGARDHGPVHPPLASGRPSNLARQVACPLVVVPPEVDQPLVALFGAHAAVHGNGSPTAP